MARIEPQPGPAEPVKITTELLDNLEGLFDGSVNPGTPVLIPVRELVAAARLGAALDEALEVMPSGWVLRLNGLSAAEAADYVVKLTRKQLLTLAPHG